MLVLYNILDFIINSVEDASTVGINRVGSEDWSIAPSLNDYVTLSKICCNLDSLFWAKIFE